MSPKKQTSLAHKLITLSYLLVENLDELKATSPEMQEYKNSLIKISELLSAEIADSTAIQKTTYFTDLCNQVDTIIRKNLNVEL